MIGPDNQSVKKRPQSTSLVPIGSVDCTSMNSATGDLP